LASFTLNRGVGVGITNKTSNLENMSMAAHQSSSGIGGAIGLSGNATNYQTLTPQAHLFEKLFKSSSLSNSDSNNNNNNNKFQIHEKAMAAIAAAAATAANAAGSEQDSRPSVQQQQQQMLSLYANILESNPALISKLLGGVNFETL
jgi:hypothetical protein